MENSDMRITNYQAHNIMRLTDIDWDLDGQHLFIVGGGNGEGKTSALTAILMALCGRSGMDWPEVALKDGEDEGWVKVDLQPDEGETVRGNLTVELFLRRKASGQIIEKFRVLDEKGHEAPQPRQLLQRLYELRAFDPMAFGKLGQKDKKALLEKLLGLDLTAHRKEYADLHKERQGVNRDLKRAEAQRDSLPRYKDAEDSEVSVSELMADLECKRAINNANDTNREDLLALRELHVKQVAATNGMKKEIDALNLAFAQAIRDDETRMMKITHYDEQSAKLVDQDLDAVAAKINSAEEVNTKVRGKARWIEADKETQLLDQLAYSLSETLEKIKDDVDRELQGAEWPLPNMSFSEDGVMMDGLPFEQASAAQQMIASVKIGMALNPRLRLLVCQDGSSLDKESLAALEKILEEDDYQMILELVTRTSEDEARCAVVIENGEALVSA